MSRKLFALAILLPAAAAIFAPAAEDAAPPVVTLPPGEVVERAYTALEMAGESQDWGVSNLNVPAAWKSTKGKGVVVAVLDTGAYAGHKDLAGQILNSKDFTGSNSGSDDRQGHGSHCAGVVAAADNDWGTVGVAPAAKLLVGKVLGDNGSGSVDRIAKGIDWSTENNADVISMSLGGSGADQFIPPALKRAREAGVIVVAAAGNSGPGENTAGFPGSYDGVICVAAHDSNNKTAGFSSRGKAVFVSGPGVNVRAPIPGPGDGLFGTMSGTSMATPHIAGLAALWVAGPGQKIAKKDRPAAFSKALQAVCSHPNTRDTATGYGKPDAGKLILADAGSGPNVITRFSGADLLTADGLRRGMGLLLNPKTVRVEFEVAP